jgi:hypothetical protein
VTLGSYWIANGTVSLELPPKLSYRKEVAQGSWRDSRWASAENDTVTLEAGEVASTWIGLFDPLNDTQFGLARGTHEFGTLACKIAIGSHEEEIRIPI